MKRTKSVFVAWAISALIISMSYVSVNDAAAQYFKGKTVTVIAPVPGGSGLDRMIRSFAHHCKKHIPRQSECYRSEHARGGRCAAA